MNYQLVFTGCCILLFYSINVYISSYHWSHIFTYSHNSQTRIKVIYEPHTLKKRWSDRTKFSCKAIIESVTKILLKHFDLVGFIQTIFLITCLMLYPAGTVNFPSLLYFSVKYKKSPIFSSIHYISVDSFSFSCCKNCNAATNDKTKSY